MKIIVKTSFIDFHKWDNAPEEVAFLKLLHRHVFNVAVECEVTHDDRELEFFMVQKRLNQIIEDKIKPMPNTKSCEQMALAIQSNLKGIYNRDFTVRIFEDNENGVEV